MQGRKTFMGRGSGWALRWAPPPLRTGRTMVEVRGGRGLGMWQVVMTAGGSRGLRAEPSPSPPPAETLSDKPALSVVMPSPLLSQPNQQVLLCPRPIPADVLELHAQVLTSALPERPPPSHSGWHLLICVFL